MLFLFVVVVVVVCFLSYFLFRLLCVCLFVGGVVRLQALVFRVDLVVVGGERWFQ